MRCCGVVLLLAALGLSCPRAPAAGKVATDPIPHLIAQLGSHKFVEREAATQALEALGAVALQPLQQAAHDEDAEVRRRACELTRRIEKRMETEQILAGRHVRLIYKNMPVVDAVADLKRKTGLNVELGGDRGKLAGRRVTLDTGDTTLWQAYEQFCDKAGLAEPGPARRPSRVASSDAEIERERLIRLQRVMMIRAARGGAIYRYRDVDQPEADARMVLVDGKAHPLPTSLAGAVRIRALAPQAGVEGLHPQMNRLNKEARLALAAHAGVEGQPAGPAEKLLALEITPEPTMQWQGILNVRVDRAEDDRGQSLSQALGPELGLMNVSDARAIYLMESGAVGAVINPHHLPVRLKAAKLPSKVLRVLKGTVAAQVQTPTQPLLTVDDILNPRGKKEVKNRDGDSLKVLGVDRQEDGLVKVHIQLTSASGYAMWNGTRNVRRRLVRRGGVVVVTVTEERSGGSALALKDVKGQELKLVSTENLRMMRGVNAFMEDVELVYQSQKGQGAPAKFVYSGPRTVIVDVPFTLKNVPLP